MTEDFIDGVTSSTREDEEGNVAQHLIIRNRQKAEKKKRDARQRAP
jgi:hypothetical protein